MQSFSRMISTFRDFYNEINPATLTGAVDVLVIEQPNGSYIGSSFYVRFGKMGVLRSREKIVDIAINDQLVNIYMKLSDTGEAFFLDRLTDTVNNGEAAVSSSESDCRSIQGDLAKEHVSSTSSNLTEHSGEPSPSDKTRSRLSSGDNMSLGNLSSQYKSASEGCIPSKIAVEDLSATHHLCHSFDAGWHSKKSGLLQAAKVQDNSNRSTSTADDLSQGMTEEEKQHVQRVREEGAALGKILEEANNFKRAEHIPKKEEALKIDEPSSGWKLWQLGSLIRGTGKRRPAEDAIYLQDLETMSPTAVNRYLPKPRPEMIVPELSEEGGSVDATEGENVASDTDSDDLRPLSRKSAEDAGYSSRPASDGGDDDIRQEMRLREASLSLCGSRVVDEHYEKLSVDDFNEKRVTLEQLTKDPSILFDQQLVVRLNDKFYPGKFGLASIVASVVFGQPLEPFVEAKRAHTEIEQPHASGSDVVVGGSGGVSSWFSWRRRAYDSGASQDNASLASGKQASAQAKGSPNVAHPFGANSAAFSRVSEHYMRSAVSDSELEDNSSSRDLRRKASQMRSRYRRCVELSSEQLKSLPLVRGINKARFSVTTKYQGTCWCECHIFLWRWDDKLVISDIDGTITKSDVLGHILPMVGAQWTQSGVTEFFSRVVDNGYRVIYLSARAIGQSQWTKDYLRWIKQGKLGLPIGPVFLSPTSLIIALHREIIEKTPEVFKTGCLMDIRALFPENVNPFYAGVGNRHNDFIAYNAVGVPPRRIFLVNPRGEVQSLVRLSSLSYHYLTDLVDHIFPPLSRSGPDDVLEPDFFEPARYSSFSYWKPRLPDISQEDENAYESGKTA